MKYIKIDYSDYRNIEEPYVYLLELDNDGLEEKEIAIDKVGNIIHKLTCDSWNGNFRWEFSKFTPEEIEKNKISKQEFYKYWN